MEEVMTHLLTRSVPAPAHLRVGVRLSLAWRRLRGPALSLFAGRALAA
jgi:hypothetical protein